ncbi:putative O-glycosylation ligase, exosortase A system-associated [Acidihalobacter ferrooxydans]|uniref:Putative O-glycosylation ligase, exosortase A system-associated n=1 Tax=Acidihalobacter ferrooxydans TaxID=1765967 RepID=A0A1P8UI70_9GAMM|nr:putative O-glycosylation ligase, exosortase A system-associated [Acidihalobacter ferrooxydans]APZ43484.1 putative O-glycosylation ligase, exosortase A system-associated [Acidihalobacter ferrooxydans]
MRGLLLILFVMGTLPMALVEPYIGLLLWTLFSDMNPYREVYGIAARIHWVYLIAVVTIFSAIIHANKLQKLKWDAMSRLMVIFVLFTTVSSYFSVVPGYAWPHWQQLFKVVLLSFFIILLVDSRKRLDLLIWVFVISFGFWGMKGGLFTLVHGGHYIVTGPEYSFYGDRNQFALAMCMTLPLMRYLQLQARSRWIRLGLWVGMALVVMSILGTYSRGGQIALAFVIPALIWKSRNRFRLLFLTAALLPLALNFMPPQWTHRMEAVVSGGAEKGGSFQGRVQSWEFATNYALHHPMLGGGFGVWLSPAAWDQYGPPGVHHRAIHSIWFEVLAEQGVVGFGLYVLMLASAWLYLGRIRRLARGDPDSLWMYDLAGFIQVSLVAFAVAGSALPQAYFNFLFQLYAVISLLLKFALQHRAAQRAAAPAARAAYPSAPARPLVYDKRSSQ